MSETEGQQVTTQETGRCEKAAHEVTHSSWNHRILESVFRMATAATIDRIAADVAAIKAKVDAVSPEDVKHFVDSEKAWVALVTEQRDAAIRERDEARAEVERLNAELAARPADGNRQATLDSSPAAPQPAAPPAGWLRDDERDVLEDLAFRIERWVNVDKYDADGKRLAALRSILARAGSPPVVEVPAMRPFGSMTIREAKTALAYRDALDAAGVPWKEKGVPRE